MIKSLFAAAILLLAVAGEAQAREIEPRAARSERALRPNQGVIILSLRSQAQLDGPLHVWFEAADDTARASADHIRFERGQGVPILGRNMIDRRVIAFAVPAGRWRLLAHATKCNDIPPPGAYCMVTGAGAGLNYPTWNYGSSSIELEVRPRTLIDAGELILEFPAGTAIDSFRQLRREGSSMRLRWRPLPAEAVAAARTSFAGLPAHAFAGPSPYERSAVSCEDDGAKINGGLTLPFDCPAPVASSAR